MEFKNLAAAPRPYTSTYKLTPSDFAFLWEECARCFYRKVVLGERRPSTPIATIFTRLDAQQKGFYEGQATDVLSPTLPPGRIECPTGWVKSSPIVVPGHKSAVWILGKMDAALRFDNGSHGIIDFKTSSPKDHHVPLYSRQLHAYAHAVENPADGGVNLPRVEHLGLAVVEPVAMLQREGVCVYDTALTWLEIPRDHEAFMLFLSDVLSVLELPEAPAGSPDCGFCAFARRGY